MPRGAVGRLTLSSRADASASSTRKTRSICGSSALKSGSSPPGAVDGVLSAMPRMPNSVACFAAASVPECQIPLPRLTPILTPDRTTSTCFPVVYSQCDAVRGCSVHTPRLDAGDVRGAPISQRPRRSDRMAGRRLFDVRRNHAHVTEARSDAGERDDARTVDTVIIGD
jgi:hypothetical protein